jgi:hypothetical protein
MKYTQQAYLGSDEEATVYYDELTGMEMATNLLQQLHKCLTIGINQRYNDAVIFTDSQMARSDRCGRDEGSQTPKHILLQCRLLSDLRDEMWRRIDRVGLKRREDFDTLVNELKTARYVADFMIKTGLLGQFQDVEPVQEDP